MQSFISHRARGRLSGSRAAAAAALTLCLVPGFSAGASEPVAAPSFESAFAPLEMDASDLRMDTVERLEAEALSQAAARPAESKAGSEVTGGIASYYGRRFAGRKTASGETFNPLQLTAAHRSLPFGSKVRVTNARNGRSVVVRINDRGPFHGKRVIDLSRAAAEEIGLVSQGLGRVQLALLD